MEQEPKLRIRPLQDTQITELYTQVVGGESSPEISLRQFRNYATAAFFTLNKLYSGSSGQHHAALEEELEQSRRQHLPGKGQLQTNLVQAVLNHYNYEPLAVMNSTPVAANVRPMTLDDIQCGIEGYCQQLIDIARARPAGRPPLEGAIRCMQRALLRVNDALQQHHTRANPDYADNLTASRELLVYAARHCLNIHTTPGTPGGLLAGQVSDIHNIAYQLNGYPQLQNADAPQPEPSLVQHLDNLIRAQTTARAAQQQSR